MEDVKIKIIQSEEFKTFFYAGDLKLLYVLILLMVLDILTGIAKAIKDRRLWSRKGLFGYGRKILIFVGTYVSAFYYTKKKVDKWQFYLQVVNQQLRKS